MPFGGLKLDCDLGTSLSEHSPGGISLVLGKMHQVRNTAFQTQCVEPRLAHNVHSYAEVQFRYQTTSPYRTFWNK